MDKREAIKSSLLNFIKGDAEAAGKDFHTAFSIGARETFGTAEAPVVDTPEEVVDEPEVVETPETTDEPTE